MRSMLLLAAQAAGSVPTAIVAQGHAAAQARLDAEFARTDRNGDESVSRDELARRLAHLRIAGRPVTPHETAALADRWFARADRDGDGKVSRSEARALFAATFARFDVNHDGRLSPAEREAAQTSLLAEAAR